jgi:hypothetical protein
LIFFVSARRAVVSVIFDTVAASIASIGHGTGVTDLTAAGAPRLCKYIVGTCLRDAVTNFVDIAGVGGGRSTDGAAGVNFINATSSAVAIILYIAEVVEVVRAARGGFVHVAAEDALAVVA